MRLALTRPYDDSLDAAGITHLDTAQGYHTTAGDSNEAATGQAISRSGLARDRIYVTTKVRRPSIWPEP